MKYIIRKILRTIQNNFPFFLEAKFFVMRIYRNIFKIPFEKDFTALSYFKNPDNALFLDIGGNRGQSTDAIIMKKNNCLIQIFEPNPFLYEKLKMQYRNNTKIIVNNFALGENAGEFTLWIPYYKRWMYDGLASLDKNKAKNWLRNEVYFYKETHLSLREVKCHVKRLDDFNFAPFFIKIDIQGYELPALKGAQETLKNHEPILLIESANADIKTYLFSFGYRFYSFQNGKFIQNTIGKLNTFFITDSKLSMIDIKN